MKSALMCTEFGSICIEKTKGGEMITMEPN